MLTLDIQKDYSISTASFKVFTKASVLSFIFYSDVKDDQLCAITAKIVAANW